MAIVGQPTTLCYDAFVGGDGVPPFTDAGGVAFGYGYGYGYHPQLLEEECLLGSHPWELPTGVLGAELGNVSAFDEHEAGWTRAIGISSFSASSSMLTFDGQGQENRAGAAWMDATDQLSYIPTTTILTGLASFSFGGCGDNDPTASASQKRPRAHAQSQHAGPEQETTTPKKQCGGDREAATKPNKTPATTSTSPHKDPQSQVAKNRRERIGERLRALQELVPNGDKVDMVTMLDKAITYVKFMQLQLKVLETDAFWPEQGGEAPEISQVTAALDAIIVSSSQHPRRSS